MNQYNNIKTSNGFITITDQIINLDLNGQKWGMLTITTPSNANKNLKIYLNGSTDYLVFNDQIDTPYFAINDLVLTSVKIEGTATFQWAILQ